MATSRDPHPRFLTAGRPTDDLDQAIGHLQWTLSNRQLEGLLRRLGDRTTVLQGLPPLRAGNQFREAVHRVAGLGVVTSDELLASAAHSCPAPLPRLETHFERIFFIFGLRRGGNHAIAEWLKGHFEDGSVLHLNDAGMGLFETRGTALFVDISDHREIPLRDLPPVCVVGYENRSFLDFPFELNSRIAKRSALIVVLRDCPNMAASIAQSARDRPHFVYSYRLRDFPPCWATYARHFRNRTGSFIYLDFNAWFSQPSYRAELSRALDLVYSDKGLNTISHFGCGSSFDGTSMDGNAQSMRVLTRWEEMMDDDLFCFLLLAGKNNLRLNQELFGNFPLTREELLLRWRQRVGRIPPP